MKQITVSLKDAEYEALLKIMESQNIECLHKAVKKAIQEYIRKWVDGEV